MRPLTSLVLCIAVAACFSKPPNNTGGPDSDGGVDGSPLDPKAPSLIATGGKHACRITSGKLLCWGNNDHGQLARPAVVDFSGVPGSASSADGWTSIAAGEQHSCGVREGIAYCWGDNTFGQSSPTVDRGAAVEVTRVDLPGGGAADRVFAGGFATCALTTMREAYCWGDLELRRMAGPASPMRLGAPDTLFTQIAIAEDHACAIVDGGGGTQGVVHCWGEGEQRQLGRESTDDRGFALAGPIDSTEQFTSLASGREATCGTTTEGKLACWGSVNQGQVGDATASGSGHSFLVVDDRAGWSAVAVGALHTCAVRSGEAYCFGDDTSGALGDGTFTSRRGMGPMVDVGMQVAQVVASGGFSCALSSDGTTMKCWGSNAKGELGNREASRKLDPAAVGLPMSARQIVAGASHACALLGGTSAGAAYCWGLNSERQVGSMSNAIVHASPQMVPGLTFTQLAAGDLHTCGIVNGGGSIACWGDNSSSQLGTSNNVDINTVTAPTGTTWRTVAAGSRMSCGITNTDTLWCWGLRGGSASAVGTPAEYPRPGGWRWTAVSIGSDFFIALADSNEPHLFGAAGAANRCAVNLPASASAQQTPTEILAGMIPSSPSFPLIASAAADGAHTCVLRTRATQPSPIVTCFGDGADGRTGGPTVCGGSPNMVDVAVPNQGTWRAPTASGQSIFTVRDHSCALDSTGKLWCWGRNGNFELGRVFPGQTPMQVNDRTWTAIAGGLDHTCGIDDPGNVYCWGENQYGQVGDGTSYEPSPVDSGTP